jgi:class 3 adenylate cyclase/DNA-binding NarL/FixJ family response regulator
MKERTLLFVDDDPIILKLIQKILYKEEYYQLFAAGAIEAIKLLETRTIDVIVTDLTMPVVDGFEFLRRAEKISPNSVRLILSGQSNSKSTLKAINDGSVFGYIVKPIKNLELIMVIRQAVEYFNSMQEKRDLLKSLDEHNKLLNVIIAELSVSANEVGRGIYDNLLKLHDRGNYNELYKNFNAMIIGLKERDFIRNTFGRYVDNKIAKELMKHPEASRLGGKKRNVTVLISDLRAFTPFAQNYDAEKVILYLNNYYSFIIETIQKFNGIIIDFYGDGLLAFFDPLDDFIIPSIRKAVLCALNMQIEMYNFNEKMSTDGFPNFFMGIGLNFGEVIVGNIGSESRAKYGIVGLPVNIANRIQSIAKAGEIILSQSLYDHINNEITIKKSFQTELKGVGGISTLYILDRYTGINECF